MISCKLQEGIMITLLWNEIETVTLGVCLLKTQYHCSVKVMLSLCPVIMWFVIYILQGENPKKPGARQNVRLYSIASTRYGDSFDGKTGSLCVRRAVYYDPETGKEDPAKKGVCSNFLCDSKPGDKIQLTGWNHLL